MELETTYLKRVQKSNFEPNFYCSLEFWKNMGWKAIEDKNNIYIKDIENDCICLPALNGHYLVDLNYPFFYSLIGMDFLHKENYHNTAFLDYNYIYNGNNTEAAKGSEYSVFRKNRKKWPERNPGYTFRNGPFSTAKKEGIKKLLIKWLEKKDGLIHCADNLLFLLEKTDLSNSFIIEHPDKDIVSWNVWDSNYKFTNYRWCICLPGEDFLDEFSRNSFHVRFKYKPINDGGELWKETGKPNGLALFKERLNPTRKKAIFSYEPQI